MTVTLRSTVGPAGGKSADGKSSSIPHKNPLTVVLAAPQGVTLSSNVAMVQRQPPVTAVVSRVTRDRVKSSV